MHAPDRQDDVDRLWADGDHRAALALLRERVRADPTDAHARRALVERYRALGHPDQAGRWGLTLPESVTDVERDRAARLLASSGVRPGDLARFLALPLREPLPPSVVDLLPEVEEHRARMSVHPRRRSAEARRPTSAFEERCADVAEALVVVVAGCLVFAFVAAVATWAGAPLDDLVLWSGLASLAVAAVAAAVRAVGALGSRRPLRATGWATTAAVLGSVVAMGVLQVVGTGGPGRDW
ncbi:tetratricopeptide repeat protein [Curtobacterium sp. MCBA15_004]|uniref:tetratricopeptide repeat protein n=1 Tax=unclassified Curtobacterium TaxID=257496 RepID=UPI0008DCB346|nr:tetratricopeptide repeat protein [Curtobacterium sp. MCBA15_004]WIA96222.1 tetratricopeptide repeat protein [Curtobacterium sp. MCBA15_004]